MVRIAFAALLLAMPAGAFAQDKQAESGQPPQRVRNIQLAPGEKCPPASGNEVVVCGTLEQPYRIPKALRDDGPVPAANQSWVNRAANVDQVSRTAGGLPDTCSPVGTGGQSGCALQINQQYAADRRAQRDAANEGR